MLKHKKNKKKYLARVWLKNSYSFVQRSKHSTLDKAEQTIGYFYLTIVGLHRSVAQGHNQHGDECSLEAA